MRNSRGLKVWVAGVAVVLVSVFAVWKVYASRAPKLTASGEQIRSFVASDKFKELPPGAQKTVEHCRSFPGACRFASSIPLCYSVLLFPSTSAALPPMSTETGIFGEASPPQTPPLRKVSDVQRLG